MDNDSLEQTGVRQVHLVAVVAIKASKMDMRRMRLQESVETYESSVLNVRDDQINRCDGDGLFVVSSGSGSRFS